MHGLHGQVQTSVNLPAGSDVAMNVAFSYIVQSVLWIGYIVALALGVWSRKVVLCLFVFRSFKKQLYVCYVFRKEVTVVMDSCV